MTSRFKDYKIQAAIRCKNWRGLRLIAWPFRQIPGHAGSSLHAIGGLVGAQVWSEAKVYVFDAMK